MIFLDIFTEEGGIDSKFWSKKKRPTVKKKKVRLAR